MNKDTLDNIISSIQEKLGEESSAIISDDLGNLITQNSLTLDSISKKDVEISSLKEKNEKLITANGSLLQMIPSKNSDFEEKEEKKESNFSFNSIFDEFGNFKK